MISCEKCGNKDPRSLYQAYGHQICKQCLRFSGAVYAEDVRGFGYEESQTRIDVSLTVFQQDIADRICKAIMKSSVFLEAVCGAGKTEMLLPFLKQCFAGNQKVGWAIPRRQVVLELAQRLQRYFPAMKIVAVCEGFTQDLEGDLVLCTTHQLYRYRHQFDYLIIDEVDAFPFSNNPVLQAISEFCYRKQVIYMSATLDEGLRDKVNRSGFKHLYCPIRPTLELMHEPKEYRLFCWVNFILMLNYVRKRDHRVLVFVPTIESATRLSKWLRWPMITSQSTDKQERIDAFRADPRAVLISTTILERGVTFENVSVLVFKADHQVFNEASLIQIAGRIRRGMQSTKGEALFYTSSKQPAVIGCLTILSMANRSASIALAKFRQQ